MLFNAYKKYMYMFSYKHMTIQNKIELLNIHKEIEREIYSKIAHTVLIT